MRAVRPGLLIVALILTGCASTGSNTSSSQQVSWWNPLSYHWSSALPWNWIDNPLTVSQHGVGGITGLTPMTEEAIDKGLNGNYHLRQGMRTQNGDVVSFWQALDDGQVKLTISGKGAVDRIEVRDSNIVSVDGEKIGDLFSDKFSKAYNNCKLVPESDTQDVECVAPGNSNIHYIYSGEWHGPEGLMPSNDTLKNWKMTRIIWTR